MTYGKNIIGTVAYMGGVMALPEKFCWSWGQMIQYNSEYVCNPGEIIHYERATASYHAYARNMICERIRGDWVLMLDTDHEFEPDIVARMLNKFQKYEMDVLSGMYQYKTHPHCPVLYIWDDEKKGFNLMGDWDKPEGEFFIPIASAGAGCLMIRRSVIKRIKDELNEGPFDIKPPFSEDHSFFKRLAELGIQAYCDPSIECHHLLVKALGFEDYKKDEVEISKPKEVVQNGKQ